MELMQTLIIIVLIIIAYISSIILAGSFWYNFLHRVWCKDNYSCDGGDVVASFFFSLLWPISAFLYLGVKWSIAWVKYLSRTGRKLATKGVS